MTDSRLVSVIVPVREDVEGVRHLISLLAHQTLPRERFEIVVGDDGSRPGALSGIETSDGLVRVVSGPPRTSYAARNRAVSSSTGAVLAFCDSDCRPEPAWLEQGLVALEGADLVAGEVVCAAPARPSVWSLLTIDMFFDQGRNVRLAQALTANLFVPRPLFDELNGFDPTLPSGGDYDFVGRAVRSGAQLKYEPRAVVQHPTIDGGPEFLRKVWDQNMWWGVRNARDGKRPNLVGTLTAFVPVLGIARARRQAFGPALGLNGSRFDAAGIERDWRQNLGALALLYVLVAYVAGLGRASGWLVQSCRAIRRARSRGAAESSSAT